MLEPRAGKAGGIMANDGATAKAGNGAPRGALARFRLAAAPGHLIRRAQQRHQDIYAEEVGTRGPTSRQFAVLLTICQRPGLTQSELGKATGIDRSTIGAMLDRLVGKRLIERRHLSRDGRANALHATKAGRRLVAQALPGVARAQARIFRNLPAGRREEALALLRVLAGMA